VAVPTRVSSVLASSGWTACGLHKVERITWISVFLRLAWLWPYLHSVWLWTVTVARLTALVGARRDAVVRLSPGDNQNKAAFSVAAFSFGFPSGSFRRWSCIPASCLVSGVCLATMLIDVAQSQKSAHAPLWRHLPLVSADALVGFPPQ
jgi:hypothetical protein